MKQIIFIAVFLLTCVIIYGQGNPRDILPPTDTLMTVNATTTNNYILTYSYRKTYSAHPATLYISNAAAEIQYYDGLGRPMESVSVKGSPLGNDIIDYKVYDAYGNLINEYLPFTKNLNNGVYVTQANFISGQNTFLTNLLYPAADVSKGYVIIEYEKSPLNRVVKQGAPGNSWQLTKPVTTTYRTNTSTDAVQTYIYTGDTYATQAYAAGKLFVTEKYDEDSKVVKEFKNIEGKLVQVVSGTLVTKYCYDQFGLLRCVIQPMGSSPASTDYCFYYKYDSKKRLIEKIIPGKAAEYMVYDSRDRLVMSQDGNQRIKTTPEWSYTMYDNLNRPVELGTWTTTLIRDTLIARVNRSLTYMSGQTSRVPLKYLYYDVYTSFPAANAYYTTDVTALGAVRSTSDIGRQTGEKTALLDFETGMNTWLFKAIYYDKYGRVIQTVSDNHLPIAGSINCVTNKYNFAGEVTQTRQRHVADYANNYTDTYMELDHRGRLFKTRYSINGATAILMSANKINEAGNLAIQYFHSENDGNFLQKNDFTYNIRGWLTKLNDPAIFTENDKFGLKLYYDTAPTGGTATFNGNISGIGWGTTSNSYADTSMLYLFTYDAVNRLTNANFSKSGIAATGLDASYVYNNNGNLTTIKNYKKDGNYIDNITIQYTGNKLNLITDLAGDVANTTDYPGNTSQVGGFTYDNNGNLTQETNKQMSFVYNMLNLPKEVTNYSGANKKIKYFYTFNGEKLRSSVENNGVITKTDYCGPFVYETVSGTRSLKYIITPHGRAVKNGSTWDYEYNLTDHLGNVRVVIHKGTSGTAEVLQERHYYPFGMEMSELSYNFGSNIANKYLYNGKEIQDDFGLYWYDYGARFYDPELARWHSIDPLSETYSSWSPYHYAMNNPIRYTDVFGMGAGDFYDERGKYLGTDGKDDGRLYVVTDKQEKKQIQKTDEAGGTTSTSEVSSATELPSSYVRGEMSKAVDRAGSPSFHEEGGFFGTKEGGGEYVVHAEAGEKADPSVDPEASVNVFKAANKDDLAATAGGTIDGTFHTHPDGTVTTGTTGPNTIGGTTTTSSFANEPSNINGQRGDIPNARANTMGVTGNSYVLAQGNKTVYIYNGSGTVATFPFKQFFSIGIKK